ncbi:MAG: hypothetical protein NVSMB46_08650 [Candidatus Saccharimonadales bacterium]
METYTQREEENSNNNSYPYDPETRNTEATDTPEQYYYSAQQLKDAENESSSLVQSNSKDTNPEDHASSFFRNDKQSMLIRSKRHLKILSKKRWLLGGAIGGGGLLIVVMFLLFFAGSLLIPNFTQHMFTYQFTRVSREFQKNVDDVMSEKIALDTIDPATDSSGGLFASLKNKYSAVKDGSWERINRFRPDKVVNNLESTSKLEYIYGEPQGVLGRRAIKAIRLNGEEIPVNTPSFFDKVFHPVESWQSERVLKQNIKSSLDDSLHGSETLIRGRVAATIRDRLNVRLSRWSSAELAKTDNEDAATADRTNLEETVKKVDDTSGTQGELVSSLSDEEKAALDAKNACLTDPVCEESILASSDGGLPQAILDKISSGVGSTAAETAVGVISPAYAVAVPVCLIYDGSLTHFGKSIDAKSTEAERTYYLLESAGHQQKSGHTTAAAVGSQGRALGITSQSNVEARARNEVVDTSNTASPQATATGDYSILQALPLGPLASVGDTIASHTCSKLTNLYVGLGVGIATDIVGFFTGEGSTAVTEGVGATAQAYISHVSETFLTKKFVKSVLGTGALIGAGTLLAKLLVVSRMGSTQSGLIHGNTFANNAEAGGNLVANEQERSGQFAAPMTYASTSLSKQADNNYLTSIRNKESAYQRYFAISNSDSLINTMASTVTAKLNVSSFGTLIQTVIGHILNPVNSFSQFASFNMRSNKVLAASQEDTTDYGIVQWGWTNEEEDIMHSDPSYALLENERIVQAATRTIQIIVNKKPVTVVIPLEPLVAEHFHVCFDNKTTMGSLLTDNKIKRRPNGDVIDNEGLCSPTNLGPSSQATHGIVLADGLCHQIPLNSDDQNDSHLVLRWRGKMRGSQTLQHMSDVADPSSSINSVALSSTGTASDGCS